MTRVLGAGRVEVAVDAGAEVGEGPLWDDERGELLWVDIPRGRVHRWRPAEAGVETIEVGQPVGAVALRRSADLLLAVRDGFAFWHDEELRMCAPVEADRRGNRMNDGKCDSAGRFWAGTMALDMRPGAGSLYRLDPDLSVSRLLGELGISNGLAWSLDDRTMYFVDSLAHGIDAFDHEPQAGTISGRRRIIDIPADEGLADGMTIDGQGYLWVALWNGWSVRRYAPDGRLDTVVELPASQITSCTFGGPDLDELFVTSAAEGLTADDRLRQPHAGAVFRVRPGVDGLPANRFAG
jgi:sugar lactone lactonase YvrE